jgi:hypothetical protein
MRLLNLLSHVTSTDCPLVLIKLLYASVEFADQIVKGRLLLHALLSRS